MTDLSHWKFVNSFTGREAALLILGVDPTGVLDDRKDRIEPVLRSILSSYLPPHYHPNEARKALKLKEYGVWIFSVQLQFALESDHNNASYEKNKKLGYLKFEEQMFMGEEIARWLAATNKKSVFPFKGLQSELALGPAADEKPISTKELNTLLTIIAVLCKEAKLDYTVTSKTAELILSTADGMGVSIGKTTIREYLKKIPDALGTRTR